MRKVRFLSPHPSPLPEEREKCSAPFKVKGRAKASAWLFVRVTEGDDESRIERNIPQRSCAPPLLGERIPRNDSRLEPLNRRRRGNETLTSSLRKRVSLLTSSPTRFMGSGHLQKMDVNRGHEPPRRDGPRPVPRAQRLVSTTGRRRFSRTSPGPSAASQGRLAVRLVEREGEGEGTARLSIRSGFIFAELLVPF